MSSNTATVPTSDAPPAWYLALRVMRVPLALAIFCIAGLAYIWFYGVPVRGLAIAIMSICIAGLFGIPYVFVWVYIMDRESRTPVVWADENQRAIGAWLFAGSDFDGVEIVDGELATRDSKRGKAYLVEEKIETEGGVDRLVATWEAGLDPWEWVENRDSLKEWREEAVPVVLDGLKRVAGADAKALKNSDRLGLELLVGQEKDEAFKQVEDSDFDWSAGVDDPDQEDAVEDDRESTNVGDQEDLVEDDADGEPAEAFMGPEKAATDGGSEDA